MLGIWSRGARPRNGIVKAGGMSGSGFLLTKAMKPRPAPPSDLSFVGYALQRAED
jgi:hypothetical protein